MGRCPVSARPHWAFDAGLGQRRLLEQLGAASLQAWNAQDLPEAHAAASALLAYAEHTQGRALSHLHGLQVVRPDEFIDLPASTRRNLELTQTLRGESAPTLLSLLDSCITGMGSRQLKHWLLAPPRQREMAQERLQAIACLREGLQVRLREQLKGSADVERIGARLSLRQVRPRELVALGHSLQRAQILRDVYSDDMNYYKAQNPFTVAEQYTATFRGTPQALTRFRQIVGSLDFTAPANEDFRAHLARLATAQEYILVPNVGHDVMRLFEVIGERNWAFYRAVFGAR
jgi:DNA mismatch repair ATPase MutS